MIFYCVDRAHFVFPFSFDGPVGCSHLLAPVKSAAAPFLQFDRLTQEWCLVAADKARLPYLEQALGWCCRDPFCLPRQELQGAPQVPVKHPKEFTWKLRPALPR